jgi:integrase
MVDTELHQIVRGFRKISEGTRKAYLVDIDRWVAFAGPDPRNWTPRVAQAFYDDLLITMSPRSAKRVMAPVIRASSWRAKQSHDPTLHFAIIQTERIDTDTDRHALTTEQAQELLATCGNGDPIDLRDRAMFIVGLETGMRRMSLVGMTLEGIHKCADGYPVADVPIKGSGDKTYPVPLSDAAVAGLEPWRRWLRSQKIAKGAVFRGLSKRIGPNGKIVYKVGDGLALVSIYKIVEHRAKQAGLDHCHPHIFRNTFITWRIQQGLSPFQIAAITGHKLANLPGMSSMGTYIDAARLGDEARAATPDWISNLTRKA